MVQPVTIDFPERTLTVTYLREGYVLGSGYVRLTHDAEGLGRLHAGEGGLLTADYEVFEGSYLRQDHVASLPARYFTFHPETHQPVLRFRPPARRVSGTYYCLGNLLTHFGHFLLDGLPSLWYLLHLPEAYRATLKYVHLGHPIPAWGWAFLVPFGITPEKVVRFTHCTQVEALIVPSASYQTHTASHGTFQAVLDTIRAYHASDIKPRKKLFLSRQQQSSRILTNQREVEQHFKQHGYRIIRPENYPVIDQIRLAASATHLAGPVGSNLYLAGFQPPDSHLHVLKPRDYPLQDDLLLAEQGHRHYRESIGSPLSDHAIPLGSWTLPQLPTL